MKKFNLFLVLMSLIFASCETEDNNKDTNVSVMDLELDFDHLINRKIGHEVNGEVKLGVSKDKVMSAFKDFVLKTDLDLEPESFEIISIDNTNYLRFYSKNHQASTIELIIDTDNQFRTGTTVCTSSACSSCCGCVPNGTYCTKCKPQGNDSPIEGDCKRTTTGFDPPNT